MLLIIWLGNNVSPKNTRPTWIKRRTASILKMDSIWSTRTWWNRSVLILERVEEDSNQGCFRLTLPFNTDLHSERFQGQKPRSHSPIQNFKSQAWTIWTSPETRLATALSINLDLNHLTNIGAATLIEITLSFWNPNFRLRAPKRLKSQMKLWEWGVLWMICLGRFRKLRGSESIRMEIDDWSYKFHYS